MLKWGTGGINIDGCRVGTDGGTKLQETTKKGDGIYKGNVNTGDFGKPVDGMGRFPANLIHDGSQEVMDLFPETKSGARNKNYTVKNKSNSIGAFKEMSSRCDASQGSAARFFYCPKASKKDRNEGCELG